MSVNDVLSLFVDKRLELALCYLSDVVRLSLLTNLVQCIVYSELFPSDSSPRPKSDCTQAAVYLVILWFVQIKRN